MIRINNKNIDRNKIQFAIKANAIKVKCKYKQEQNENGNRNGI